MAKKSLPSKKTIRELLIESVFDPRESDTPFSIVIGMQDASYCEAKAIELIHEARLIAPPGSQLYNTVESHYHEKIAKAVSLLTLARSFRGPVQPKEERGSGEKDPGQAN